MRLKCEAVSGNNKKQGVTRNRTNSRNNNSNWFLLVSLTLRHSQRANQIWALPPSCSVWVFRLVRWVFFGVHSLVLVYYICTIYFCK